MLLRTRFGGEGCAYERLREISVNASSAPANWPILMASLNSVRRSILTASKPVTVAGFAKADSNAANERNQPFGKGFSIPVPNSVNIDQGSQCFTRVSLPY